MVLAGYQLHPMASLLGSSYSGQELRRGGQWKGDVGMSGLET